MRSRSARAPVLLRKRRIRPQRARPGATRIPSLERPGSAVRRLRGPALVATLGGRALAALRPGERRRRRPGRAAESPGGDAGGVGDGTSLLGFRARAGEIVADEKA